MRCRLLLVTTFIITVTGINDVAAQDETLQATPTIVASPVVSANASPVIAATPDGSPTAEAEATPWHVTATDWAEDIEKPTTAWTDVIWAIIKLFGALLVLFAGIIFIPKLARRLFDLARRPRELIVPNFENATGKEELDKVMPGLSQVGRQQLARQILSIRQDCRSSVSKEAESAASFIVDKAPLPADLPDQRLKELATALGEVAPQAKVIATLINLAMPPKGSQVTGTLVRLADTTQGVGISVRIVDLQSEREPSFETFWERRSRSLPPDPGPAPRPFVPATDKDFEARGLWELGRVYQQIGHLTQAATHYEEVVKKRPDFSLGHTALAQVLTGDGSLAERYYALLKPAVRWIALESSAQELIAAKPKRLHDGDEERWLAGIWNFFGVLAQADGHAYGDRFYRLSIEYLQRAIDHASYLYRAHENLADTLSFLGRVESQQHVDRGKERQLQAILSYHAALERTTISNETRHNLPPIPDRESVRNRINVSMAIAEYLTGEPVLITRAYTRIAAVTATLDLASTNDSRVLYNLACWYSIVAGEQDDNAESSISEGLEYLQASLRRDPSLWRWAEVDDDLKTLREYGVGIAPLKFQIVEEQTS